jgi:hypothetical protein
VRKIIIGAAATMLLALVLAGQAFAWNSNATHISCGQADFTLSKQTTPWQYTISEDGKIVKTGSFANPTQSTVTIGVRASSDDPHVITVSVVYSSGGEEVGSSITGLFVNCGPTTGLSGPAGPPGVGTPGINGKDGVTTIITKTIIEEKAPKTCTSRRDYSFRVRKSYQGSAIVGVKAAENSLKVDVAKKNGRFVVSWSTKGKHYTRGGVLRSMTVNATLANGRYVRLRWFYRPCLTSDGAPNDPSAAGQGRAFTLSSTY